MMDHELIAKMHAAAEVTGRKNDFFIRAVQNHLVFLLILNVPAAGLIRAWNGNIQTDIRILLFCSQHFFGSQGIKSKCAAADKPSVSPDV